ncbi:tyrosine-type recombinase/integrase [Nonomuraea sp. NPDC050556]|uniref:tyrosine-type recombinase/integrase n=1 Tax=Nonomuraea sp. NPDC050556 TaxID=3364369 RepID=UPI0037A20D28
MRRHDLRHTGLTWMADAGVPVHVLRKIAGHGALTTTQRYLHPFADAIAAAGMALSAHLTTEGGLDDQHHLPHKQKGQSTRAFAQTYWPVPTVGTTGFEPATP